MTGQSHGNADSAPRMSRLPRWMHRWWADLLGYFWLPCPVCGRFSGGHEWRAWNGNPSVVPDLDQPWTWHGICPSCTRAGYGYEDRPVPVPSGGSHLSKVLDSQTDV